VICFCCKACWESVEARLSIMRCSLTSDMVKES
jgi:hypothetical protein